MFYLSPIHSSKVHFHKLSTTTRFQTSLWHFWILNPASECKLVESMTYLNLNLSEVLSRGERAEVGELIFDKSLTQSLIATEGTTRVSLSVVDVHWRQKRVETWNEYCACLFLHLDKILNNTIQDARKTQMLGLDVERTSLEIWTWLTWKPGSCNWLIVLSPVFCVNSNSPMAPLPSDTGREKEDKLCCHRCACKFSA